jgi:hypothetical protein
VGSWAERIAPASGFQEKRPWIGMLVWGGGGVSMWGLASPPGAGVFLPPSGPQGIAMCYLTAMLFSFALSCRCLSRCSGLGAAASVCLLCNNSILGRMGMIGS